MLTLGNICTTRAALDEIVGAYSRFDEFVFDVETTGPHRGHAPLARVSWLALAGPGRSDVIPLGHPNGKVLTPAKRSRVFSHTEMTPGGEVRRYKMVETPATFGPAPEQLTPAVVFDALRPLFFSERRKIGHNVKFDLSAVAKYFGEVPPAPYGDTMIVTHLLNESLGSYRLADILRRVFSDPKRPLVTYGDGKLGKIGVDKFDFQTVARYAHLDASWTWLLWRTTYPSLASWKLRGVFRFEMDVLRSVIDMETEGFFVDGEAITNLNADLADRIARLEKVLSDAAGGPWKYGDHESRGRFVYEIRGHKPKAFTAKTGRPSTRKADLDSYAKRDKTVAAMVEHAHLSKLRSTYVDGLAGMLVNDRLHPSFKQHGTQTGRFSCAEPNLQNIPRHTDADAALGQSIRALFVAPGDDWVIVDADYDQIELRMLAHYSQDPTMVRTFLEGLDIHTETATALLGRPPENGEERTVFGKVPNFAVVYGAGPEEVARQAKVGVRKAEEFLDMYARRFPKVMQWKQQAVAEAMAQRPPHVRTIVGRVRRLYGLYSHDRGERGAAQRQAVNTIIQGSAADVMKMALVDLGRELRDTPCRLVGTVHDEVLVHAPVDWADRCMKIVETNMTGVADKWGITVPLTVDVKTAKRWSEAK